MESVGFPSEPIYKGATRPPMFLGVPIVPFLLVAGIGFLAGLYILVLASIAACLGVAAVVTLVLVWMRGQTRQDDQRLNQLQLYGRLLVRCPNARLWRSRTYAPLSALGGRNARGA